MRIASAASVTRVLQEFRIKDVTAGRILIAAGVLLVILGLVAVAAEKLHLPLGRLPGDLIWRRGNTTIYAPLATCFLLSLAASAAIWLLGESANAGC